MRNKFATSFKFLIGFRKAKLICEFLVALAKFSQSTSGFAKFSQADFGVAKFSQGTFGVAKFSQGAFRVVKISHALRNALFFHLFWNPPAIDHHK